MYKTFTLLLSVLIFSVSVSAQVLTGFEAAQIFPGAVKVRLDEKTKLPKHVELNATRNLSLDEAIHALSKNSNIGDRVSFQFLKRTTDQLGMTHHRYQQLINGIPVVAGIYLFHTENGIVKSMNGELFNFENNTSQVSITPERAIDLAKAEHPDASYGWEVSHGGGLNKTLSEYPEPKLAWVPVGLDFGKNQFELAYEMDFYAIHGDHHHRTWMYMDVQTGEVIAENNQICDVDVPSQVFTNNSDYRQILTEKTAPDSFLLRQTTYGNGVFTLNALNFDTQGGAENNSVDFVHEDSIWGVEFGFSNRYALDAHFGAEQYYLFLESFFNRNSIDEEGHPLVCYVHFGEDYANAFWNGSASFYGDGGSGTLDRPLVTLDIVAHEFTHGLTGFTAGLIYAYEPGALNESFSDIFGLATDFYARQNYSDWTMGEEATSSGNGIRSALDPQAYGHPKNYQGDDWWYDAGDNGGVHINSGVQNHWFYLLSEGGTGVNDNGEAYEVQGIGWEKAVTIAYRNLTTYLTAGSVFADAAYYGSLSALELYGACSPEYVATVNAWHAVGIGNPFNDESNLDFVAQRIFCAAPAEVQFSNYSTNYETVEWNFGDNTTSTEYAPSHTYMTDGTYDVTLNITKCDGTAETLTKTEYIIIDSTDPICTAYTMLASDTTTVTACSGTILDPGELQNYPDSVNSVITINPPTTDPIILTFSEFSTRFGDVLRIYDGANTNAPILAQYVGNNVPPGQMLQSSEGVMTLEFTTNNDTFVRPGFIASYTISGSVLAPQAAFTPSTLTPSLNAPVQFMDNSMSPALYFWDFDDGTTSTEAEPVHQFAAAGTYSVKQVITNCSGIDSTTMDITVGEGGVLTLDPGTICVTLNAGDQLDSLLTISNTGLGNLYYSIGGSNVDWLTFEGESDEIAPGGFTTIDISFDATGLEAGSYLFNAPMQSGDSTQLSLGFLVKMIVLPFPQVGYTNEVEDICNGTYQFTDVTLNGPTSWFWDFGDGNNSTDQSPVHEYQEEGVYDVSLIACNDLGCDSIMQEQLIVVSYCDSLTIGETGYSFFDNCNGLIYDQGGPDENYANNSDYVITIAPTGADFVTLTILQFQLQPNLDRLYVHDGMDTNAPIIYTLTGGLGQNFMINSSGAAITLRFETNDALTFAGFQILWTCNGDLLPPPDAAFTFADDANCSNAITFDAMPAGVYNYNWDFGDGNIWNLSDPMFTYNYQTAGTYTVNLEVSNAVGTSNFQETITIDDIPFTLDAQLSAEIVDINEVFTMDAIVDITPQSYTWIPQAGDTLSGASASYSYTMEGDYIIYLEVTDSDGCSMFVEKPITVTNLTGAEELSVLETFSVIPNPSNGQFTLSLEFIETKNAELLLFNTLGQVLYQESLGTVDLLNKDLNFDALAGGIYFLSIITENGVAGVQRLVIQK